MKESESPKKIIFTLLLSPILLILLWSSFFIVDAGEKAVHLRTGAIIRTVDAGIYLKYPIFDSVKKITTRTMTSYYRNINCYSKDQQPAKIQASVTLRITGSDVEKVYMSFQTVERLVENTVDRQLPNQIENIFGKYSAIEAVQNREMFVKDVTQNLKTFVSEYPITIKSVQIEDIDFSEAYEQSVEARMRAEVEVQTQKQNLEKERINAEIAVTKAQAQADSLLVQARAEAESISLKGQAEANAINAKNEALKMNNNMIIELTKAEKWDGKLPTTVLPNSSIPFIEAIK